MRKQLENAATGLVVLSAIAVGIAALHREFGSRPQVRRYVVDASTPPRYNPNWTSWREVGVLIGSEAAPVTLVEFADFECEFCRRFHGAYIGAKRALGDSLALLFIHYPLRRHRFARPAARAAECAHSQGRFSEYHSAMFDKQDSLGLKSWASFAIESGISDTIAFNSCALDTASIRRIEAGVELANAEALPGTPSVIINGWQFAAAPYDSLTETIRSIMAKKPPYHGGR